MADDSTTGGPALKKPKKHDIPLLVGELTGVGYLLKRIRQENHVVDEAANRASHYMDRRIAATGKEEDKIRKLMVKHGGWYDTGESWARHRNYTEFLNEVLHEAGEAPVHKKRGLALLAEAVGVGAMVYLGAMGISHVLGEKPVESMEKPDTSISR
jgi:hypothetical protein